MKENITVDTQNNPQETKLSISEKITSLQRDIGNMGSYIKNKSGFCPELTEENLRKYEKLKDLLDEACSMIGHLRGDN